MQYKIVEKEAFKVVGEAFKVSIKNGENLIKIPEFWNTYNTSGKSKELCKEFKVTEMYGISLDTDKETFTYMICVRGGEGYKGKKYVVKGIPKATWAVFPVTGAMPAAIQKAFKKIFQEWFLTSGYDRANGPIIEVYPESDSDSYDYYSEIWVPIKKTIRSQEGVFAECLA